jgi:hypothetical protein
VIALPPLLDGAVHTRLITDPEYVAVGVDGTPGTVLGITALPLFVRFVYPDPTSFTGVTCTKYGVPLVRNGISTLEDIIKVPLGNCVQGPEKLVEYSTRYPLIGESPSHRGSSHVTLIPPARGVVTKFCGNHGVKPGVNGVTVVAKFPYPFSFFPDTRNR